MCETDAEDFPAGLTLDVDSEVLHEEDIEGVIVDSMGEGGNESVGIEKMGGESFSVSTPSQESVSVPFQGTFSTGLPD